MYLDYLNSQDDQKNELPEWYQDSALGQFVKQQQNRAYQWFGDVLGVNPDTGLSNPLASYTDPITQYSDQLKKQGQQWFMQTPVGQGVNDFYTGYFEPMRTNADQVQKGYQARLQSLYGNGR